jgi:gliding motility-associated-like protein
MGSYLVQYCTGNITTGCIDTVKKTIFIGWRNADIVLTPDTTICFGTNKMLRSNIDSSLQFCWNPNSFLNNVDFASPATSTPSTITYTLLAASEENNLIRNGDFSNPNINISFTTDYDGGSAPLSTAEYIVASSSLNAGPSTADCKDHTTASGNMMLVRNDFTANAEIWGQTVTVLPNTTYMFSAWVQSLASPNNAQLQFSINGNKALDNITTAASTCTWTKHFIVWNSGNNTRAKFSILNKATAAGADDYFAIDDISLALYSIKKDSVKISVDTPFVDTRTDTSICESVAVTLNTIGAATYSWAPAAGLSNVSIANPIATPADTTKYFVTGTNVFGCTATDSVTISVKPKPVITSTGDTTVCRNTAITLFASGGVSYSWSPAAALNNPNIANPVANAANADTKYVVTVTGADNCSSEDSFTVNVKAIPLFTISPDKSVCLTAKPQLNATGGEYYLWSPASLVSNANISNPVAIATVTTPYSVLIRDTLCGDDTTLFTTITILPLPTITAAKENDINCAIGSANLTATGASQYNWAPTFTLNDATSATPIASPANTTTYTVTGTDSAGCSNTASVTVFADYTVKVGYAVPNAFTPNGDELNKCFRVKYFGLIQEFQLMIYNRWGENVFFTTNPNDCWDGTYKGSPCRPGNFVYYLKAKTVCGNVVRKGNVLLIR